jgi:hypothetical protein
MAIMKLDFGSTHERKILANNFMKYTFIDFVNAAVEAPTVSDIHGIAKLAFTAFWRELKERETKEAKSIYIDNLISFMRALGGRNKTGSKNGIGRLAYFLNAFSEELSLWLANQNALEFIGNDHFELIRGGHGTDDPDCVFTCSNGYKFTLEVKMYYNQESYNKAKIDTNFHKADYCIAFILESKEWLFSRRADNYNVLYTVEELSDTDPWLAELNLPTCITTVQFSVPGKKLNDLTDEELLSAAREVVEGDIVKREVSFRFYENKTANFYKREVNYAAK